VSDQEAELQTIITSLCAICEVYGMEVNVKKTKTMVLNKFGKTQCTVTANGAKLEQVSQYKCLGSWITEDGRCEQDIKTRIAMAKDAFWKQRIPERKY